MSILTQIIQRLNDIQNNAKGINELGQATNGNKESAVYNTDTHQTQKLNLDAIVSSNIPDGFISTDTELIDQDFIINSAQWYVNGQLNILEFQVPSLQYTIALAGTGLQRIDLFYGNAFGQILRIIGDEAEVAVEPTLPANSVRLTAILSTDTGSTAEPIELNGFVQKIYSSYAKISTDIRTLPLDGRTNFVIGDEFTTVPEFFGFSIPSGYEHDFEGKRYVIRNLSSADCVLTPSGVDRTFAEAFTLEPGKGVEFDVFGGVLRMVGGVVGGGTTVHNELTGRDASNAHPISAITGLQTALDDKLEEVNTNDIVNHAVTNVKLAQMNANTVKGRLSGNGTPQDIAMADLPISTAQATVNNSKLDKEILPLSITTNVNASSLSWNDREVEIDNSTSDIVITIDTATRVYGTKTGSGGSITFVSGSGRVLKLLSQENVATSQYSKFLIGSVGTDDVVSVLEFEVNLYKKLSDFRHPVIPTTAWTGTNPKIASVVLSPAYVTDNYSVDAEFSENTANYAILNKTAAGFDFYVYQETAPMSEVLITTTLK